MVVKKKFVENEDDSDSFEDDLDSDDEFDSGDESFDESFDDFDTGMRNQADVVKIWLGTEPYLNNIYLSITNQQVKRISEKVNGKRVFKTDIVPIEYKENGVSVTLKPLANNLGVSQIMSELKVFLSSPLVQGNLSDERYRSFMLWYEQSVNTMLWTNRLLWDIKVYDVQGIYNKIVGSVGLFLTRPLGNLERGRQNWNPNQQPMNDDSGFVDKLAFWRKKKNMDVGG